MAPDSHDVIVVGAGFAGLRTALVLADAGLDVLVLEARQRVGGRSWSMTADDGHVIDRGGQWIGPGQERLAALANETGVDTFPTYTVGRNIELRDGVRFEYTGLIPTSDHEASIEVVMAMLDLDLLAMDVSIEAPWETTNAAALDEESFGSYLDRTLTSPVARRIVEVATRAIWGADADELSLLYVLAYLHGGGGFSNLSRTTAGAQERRFATGSGSLADAMAERLGLRLHLGAVVQSITWDQTGVSVRAAGAASPFTARHCVVAVPPRAAAGITLDPEVPARRGLAQGMPMGRVIKVHVRYDRPFWRDLGLSGQLISTSGSVSSTFDNSPADGSVGALVGFIAGSDLDFFVSLEPEARRRRVLDELVFAFGADAAHATEYHEVDWTAEEFTQGGPVGVCRPGTLTTFGSALRAPVGPLHFAGSETALVWAGYLEGALESGDRAAAEILALRQNGEV